MNISNVIQTSQIIWILMPLPSACIIFTIHILLLSFLSLTMWTQHPKLSVCDKEQIFFFWLQWQASLLSYRPEIFSLSFFLDCFSFLVWFLLLCLVTFPNSSSFSKSTLWKNCSFHWSHELNPPLSTFTSSSDISHFSIYISLSLIAWYFYL